MKTYHLIQETTLSNGVKKVYAHCLSNDETFFSVIDSLDKHEKALAFEVVSEKNKTDFKMINGVAFNVGVPCSTIERERNQKAIFQFLEKQKGA